MAIVKSSGIILKTDNYRHSSKLITLLTNDYGKIKCIAKGVRDVKCKWGSVLQPMAYVNIIFYMKENTLHLLSQADYAEYFYDNFQDYDKILTGLKMVELVNLTTEYNHRHPEVFNLLLNYLKVLDKMTEKYRNLLFSFKSKMSGLLGFEIDFFKLRQNRNYMNIGIVKDSNSSPEGRSKLTKFEINIVETLVKGNFNDILSLNISDESAEFIDKFFNDYYNMHYDNLNFKVHSI